MVGQSYVYMVERGAGRYMRACLAFATNTDFVMHARVGCSHGHSAPSATGELYNSVTMTDWAGKLNDMGLSVDQVSLMPDEEQDEVMSRLGIRNDTLQQNAFLRFLARNPMSLMPVEQQDEVMSRNNALQQAEFYRLLARQMPDEEQDQAMSRLGIGNDALQLVGLIRLLARRQALLCAPSTMHCQSQPTDVDAASFAPQPPPRKKLKQGEDSGSEMSDTKTKISRLYSKYCELQSPKALMNAKEGDFT